MSTDRKEARSWGSLSRWAADAAPGKAAASLVSPAEVFSGQPQRGTRIWLRAHLKDASLGSKNAPKCHTNDKTKHLRGLAALCLWKRHQ